MLSIAGLNVSVRACMAQAAPSVQSSQPVGCHPLLVPPQRDLLVPLQPQVVDSHTRCAVLLSEEFDICCSAHVGSNCCCRSVGTTCLKGPLLPCWPLGTRGIRFDGRNYNMCTACTPNPPGGVGGAFPVLPCHACEKESGRIIVGARKSGMSCTHPSNECRGKH